MQKQYEQPPEINDEDEEILNAVWDRIVKEETEKEKNKIDKDN